MKNVDPTIFVGVYGSLRPHPGVDAQRLTEDAYSLLRRRSQAMGQSSADGTVAAVKGWGIHDAGQSWLPGSTANQLAWFQVGLARDAAVDVRQLPVTALLGCVEACLNRVGTAQLEEVQLLLPIQFAGVALGDLTSIAPWFDVAPSESATTAWVTVDAGESDVLRSREDAVAEGLRQIDLGSFDIRIDPSAPIVEPQPPVVSEVWLGQGHHRITFTARLPEWSLDAIAWATSVLAEVLHRSDLATTVLVSWRRAE